MKVIADQSMSLDGFSTGPNVRVGNGMGDGGDRLHEWMGWEDGGPAARAGARDELTPFDQLERSGLSWSRSRRDLRRFGAPRRSS